MFISVIMAAHNAERFIGDAIRSVLQQTHEDFELIVVDDGSVDRTSALLAEFSELDSRIRIISQSNQGAGAARNAAVAAARSQWIAVMDSDDVMEPTRLERQIKFIEQHPDLVIASCLVTWINEKDQVMGRSHSNLTNDRAVRWTLQDDGILVMCHPGCIIRRDAIIAVGGYRSEFWPSEDIDLFSRIADTGARILVQPEYLLKYRIHPASGTGQTSNWDSTLHRWIWECSRRRKQGLPEPTFEEFQTLANYRSWFQRSNQWRIDVANILYNKATFAYSTGHVVVPVLFIVCSALLDPAHAPLKVWRRFLHPRIPMVRSSTSR